jgi:hypothetical protein
MPAGRAFGPRELIERSARPAFLQGAPEVPLRLEGQPDLGVPAREGFEQRRGIALTPVAP